MMKETSRKLWIKVLQVEENPHIIAGYPHGDNCRIHFVSKSYKTIFSCWISFIHKMMCFVESIRLLWYACLDVATISSGSVKFVKKVRCSTVWKFNRHKQPIKPINPPKEQANHELDRAKNPNAERYVGQWL